MKEIQFYNIKSIINLLLTVILLGTAAIFIWMYYSNIDDTVTSVGKVIPSDKIQLVQNPDPGIIKSIHTHAGDRVEKGQLLVKMDDTSFSAELKQYSSEKKALKLKQLRLLALLKNKDFIIPEEFKKALPEQVLAQKRLYHSLRQQSNYLKQQKTLLDREIKMTEPLIKQGASTPVELLHLKRKALELKGLTAHINIKVISELETTERELSKINQLLIDAKNKVKHTFLISPVNGIVKKVNVTTIGGVVNAGSNLIEIVPISSTLIVDTLIKPADIGFIKIGQEAIVKITAYDFAQYGYLRGRVIYISADASSTKDNQHYFEVSIKTDKNYFHSKTKKLLIIPGMQATVEIITGKQSLISYLLSPLLRFKDFVARN